MEGNKHPGIARGQSVAADQLAFARRLRRDLSPVERLLWARLRSNNLNGLHFRRQQVVGPYVADFYCCECRLAIEVDGDTHEDQSKDARRDTYFESLEITVLRFSNAQVTQELEAVLEHIPECGHHVR